MILRWFMACHRCACSKLSPNGALIVSFTRCVLIAGLSAGVAAAQTNPILPETTTRVSDHVYAIMGWPNVAIVTGSRGTLVVDTGLGPRNGATIARIVNKLAPNTKIF